jgi:molybdopterin synthase sulfur carrier subunit
MHVSVKLFATLVEYVPGTEPGASFKVEIPDGISLSGLMKKLDLPEREAKIIFVNGHIQSPDYQLQDNDEVGVFPPIGGG